MQSIEKTLRLKIRKMIENVYAHKGADFSVLSQYKLYL